jgi:hypothetical protein
LILLQYIREPKNILLIVSYSCFWSLATSAIFPVPARLYGAPQLSGAVAGVVGVAANLLQWHPKSQLESFLEACGDALSAECN